VAEMIFVTVGASLSFDRLIEYIDKEIAPISNEKIIAQIHDSSVYIPQNIDYIQTQNKKSFDEHIKSADLIISHAGMGVILDCIKYHKKLILVPRDPSLGEHIDAHQYEICEYLEDNNKGITIVYDLDDLYDTIINKMKSSPPIFEESKKNLMELRRNISAYLSKNYSGRSNIFIVCSSGGHLRQMLELIDVFPKKKIILITNNTKIELEGIRMHIIKGDLTDKLLYIRSCLEAPCLIFKYRPSIIFTNGGGELSIPFSFFGKLFRRKILFMETISRVNSKSKAAQLIYPIADVFLVQWEKNLSKYGKKAKFWGSVI
jgi:beta-1,4-N-acetylglucosaminyltransferase